ncbi:MAG: hypothetical protein LBF65_00765 [Holosporales bacterium]|jgi:hypothetical protein|nr:hypothetical protein [Holosporales bacterium]
MKRVLQYLIGFVLLVTATKTEPIVFHRIPGQGSASVTHGYPDGEGRAPPTLLKTPPPPKSVVKHPNVVKSPIRVDPKVPQDFPGPAPDTKGQPRKPPAQPDDSRQMEPPLMVSHEAPVPQWRQESPTVVEKVKPVETANVPEDVAKSPDRDELRGVKEQLAIIMKALALPQNKKPDLPQDGNPEDKKDTAPPPASEDPNCRGVQVVIDDLKEVCPSIDFGDLPSMVFLIQVMELMIVNFLDLAPVEDIIGNLRGLDSLLENLRTEYSIMMVCLRQFVFNLFEGGAIGSLVKLSSVATLTGRQIADAFRGTFSLASVLPEGEQKAMNELISLILKALSEVNPSTPIAVARQYLLFMNDRLTAIAPNLETLLTEYKRKLELIRVQLEQLVAGIEQSLKSDDISAAKKEDITKYKKILGDLISNFERVPKIYVEQLSNLLDVVGKIRTRLNEYKGTRQEF